jgi:hypothetical protein
VRGRLECPHPRFKLSARNHKDAVFAKLVEQISRCLSISIAQNSNTAIALHIPASRIHGPFEFSAQRRERLMGNGRDVRAIKQIRLYRAALFENVYVNNGSGRYPELP